MNNIYLFLIGCFFVYPTICYADFDKGDSIKKYKWNSFVKENGIPVNFNNAENNCDFSFLKRFIGDKSVVFLGEQSHCCKESNLLKGQIIKFMNRQMDFDVIAFEISMNGYCLRNLVKKKLTLEEFSYGTWNTKENTSLFSYIKDSMELAGIDVIPSFNSVYLKQLLGSMDSNTYDFFKNVDSSLNELNQTFFKNNKMVSGNGIVPHYEFIYQDSVEPFKGKAFKLICNIDSTERILKKDLLNISNKEQEMVSKSFENKIKYVQYLLNNHNYLFRDSLMGQNLKWLTDGYYLGNKIIVWAADAHIHKDGMLSRQLSAETKSKRYHIGIFNSNKTSLDLFTSDAIFIDLSGIKNVRFNEKNNNDLLKNYDAIILLKNTTSCDPNYKTNTKIN